MNSTFLKVLVGFGAVFLFVFFVWNVATVSITNSRAYNRAIEISVDDPQVISSIGEPVRQRGFILGSINISGNQGTAELLILLKGSYGKGSLNVYAKMSGGEWRMEELFFDNAKSPEIIKLLK